MKTRLAVSTAIAVVLVSLSVGASAADRDATVRDYYGNFCGSPDLRCDTGSNPESGRNSAALPYSPVTKPDNSETYGTPNTNRKLSAGASFNETVYGGFCGSTRIPC